MDRRSVTLVSVALIALVAAPLAAVTVWSGPSDPLGSDHSYPPGAGPDHINFSALPVDNATVADTPRSYWDSYAILHSAPSERRFVEGEYYINSTTGEIIGQRWHNGTVYINGSIYAFVQPAESLPEHQREQFESDLSYIYDTKTEAYYRYDPQYGQLAPTNIGRHTTLVEPYTWEAINTTTHHGVSVITYRVTGTQASSQAPPAINGTLQLGVEDGIVYAYDLTVDTDKSPSHYTYEVRPAPFPDHEWVNRARGIAANNSANQTDQE